MNVEIEKYAKVFETDGFVQNNSFKIVSVGSDGAVVKVNITDKHINAAGTVHGGLLFSLADFAFGVAANFLHPLTITSSASVTFLAPCGNVKALTAECREISRYRHTCVYNAVIRDDCGNIVCTAQLNGFIKDNVDYAAKFKTNSEN